MDRSHSHVRSLSLVPEFRINKYKESNVHWSLFVGILTYKTLYLLFYALLSKKKKIQKKKWYKYNESKILINRLEKKY